MTPQSILDHFKNGTFIQRSKEKMGELAVDFVRWNADKYSIQRNKIVFDNFGGKGFADHPRYIAEEIHRRGLDWEMVWLVNNIDEQMPSWIRKVRFGSWQSVYDLSTAQFWVDNIRNAHLVNKKENQIYLQTWHGSMPFKQVEKDVESMLHPLYVQKAKYDGSIIDAILSSSRIQSNQFKRCFWLSKESEILEFGGPRCDCLFDSEYVESTNKKMRCKLSIGMEDYVVLYAPTFRDDGSTSAYYLNFEAIKEAFQRKIGRSCKIITRLHPNVNSEEFFLNNEWMINGGQIPDSTEVVICADAIITDFSSIMYEACLLKKVCFRCALDYDEYIKNRSLLPLEQKTPFLLSKSTEELIDQIKSFEYTKYNAELQSFFTMMNLFENGHASEKTVDWLENRLNRNIQ